MQVLDPALTRYEALGLLPEQLHPFIIFHDFDEPLGTFDRLKKASETFQGDPGPGTSLSRSNSGHEDPWYNPHRKMAVCNRQRATMCAQLWYTS